MSVYYPQAALTLRIRWEDFGQKTDQRLQQIYALPILAKSVVVHRNEYTMADTFEAEIDYKQFPFDPRCIRACGVTISMANVKQVFAGDNSLTALKPSAENTIFLGFADEEGVSFNEAARTVRFEGRDLTSLLIDRDYLKGTVPLDKPVDQVIDGMLKELKETAELKLDNRVPGELPVLANFYTDKDELSGKKNVKKGEKYWDVIQDIVGRAGLIAYIEIDRLVLSKPRVLYDAKQAKRFIYGRNIVDLQFKRKIGRRRDFNVIVRSMNLATKSVLEAKIPLEATAEWSEGTGIGNSEVKSPQMDAQGKPLPEDQLKAAPYISLVVPDCNSKEQLVEIGQAIYEEIGRQQIEGSFKTREMEATSADGNQFNLLKLSNGTPIEIGIDQGDLKGLSDIKDADPSQLVARRRAFLLRRGYDETVADLFAQSMGRFQTIFYTKSVRFSLDVSNGFQMEVEFLNFIQTGLKPPGAR